MYGVKACAHSLVDRVPHSECGGEGSIPSERTIEFRENAMDRGTKVRIATAIVVFSISLGLFIFAQLLHQTEVKYISQENKGGETILKCNYNGDEEEYSSNDIFYVKTGQKIELKKGDTMTIFHFGHPEENNGHYDIKSVHVTKHTKEK